LDTLEQAQAAAAEGAPPLALGAARALGGALASALGGAATGLARLEPFDAYLLTAGAWASAAWAVGGLALAALVPRGYCRFGCPAGALLGIARVRPRRR
jgi:polyferredoxin